MATSLADIFAAMGKANIKSSGKMYDNPFEKKERNPAYKSASGGVSGTTPEGQLALYAAALGDKDFVRADAFTPKAGGIADPITNTEPRYWERAFPNWGAGEPYGMDQRDFALRPWAYGHNPMWGYFGDDVSRQSPPSFNVDAYPQVTGSQFGPYQATAFNTALNTWVPQGPHSGPQHLIPPYWITGDWPWYAQDPLQTHPTGGQINRARMANAIRATDHYNRAWAAGPSYGGGY